MIDITLQNLEAELVTASIAQPVLLDIWAPWCGPCRTLGPLLEKLEVAYAGRFKLAKLNSDDQPEIAGQLSQSFGVRSIPFCVLFKGGQPVDGFVGAQGESEIRAFLDRHLPSPAELEAETEVDEAEALAAAGDTDAALAKLHQALAIDPANDVARLDCVKLLLERGDGDAAAEIFAPLAPQAMVDLRIAAFGHWVSAWRDSVSADATALATALAANKRDFDARFALAQVHFAQGHFVPAMDELLEIILRDKGWRDELARKTYVAVLEVMTKPPPKPAAGVPKGTLELTGKSVVAAGDPVLDQYRRKLSMALF